VLSGLGFVFFLLIAGAGQAYAHDRIVLNARRATPGIRLEMYPLTETATATDVRYWLQAAGLPKGVKFLLWAKEFDHSVHQLVASVFQIDRFGNVMASNSSGGGRPRRLDQMSFGPGRYPAGALWEVALVSVDRKLQAFAKGIPYPITANAGECTVSLELVSHRGEKFLASGHGFVPGEEVTTESRYAERVSVRRERISPDGKLLAQVILHASTGSDRNAHYLVKASSCQVVVDYSWGEAALVRR
jgi:hypothetical protein